jgi:beta-phosphoglucomutase-like phosphatase (HAD superfamily)
MSGAAPGRCLFGSLLHHRSYDDELGTRQYFKGGVSAYSMPGKPDPTVFLAAAWQLDVEPG